MRLLRADPSPLCIEYIHNACGYPGSDWNSNEGCHRGDRKCDAVRRHPTPQIVGRESDVDEGDDCRDQKSHDRRNYHRLNEARFALQRFCFCLIRFQSENSCSQPLARPEFRYTHSAERSISAPFPVRTASSYIMEEVMSRIVVALLVILSTHVCAQQAAPLIAYDAVNPLKLPKDLHPRRSDRRRRQLEGPHVRVLARQHDRPRVRRSRRAAARVRPQRQVHARDRQEPLRLVVRPHGARRPQRQHLGAPTRARTWWSSSIPQGTVMMVFGRKQEASRRGHRRR